MIISKRERVVGLLAVLVVLLLLGDRLIVSPWRAAGRELRSRREALLDEWSRARRSIERHRQLQPVWQEMIESDRLQTDRAALESRVLHALREWAEQAGFSLTSTRPERMVEHDGMTEVVFQASGHGGLVAAAEFMRRLESADLPVRIVDLQLTARGDGRDDLQVQLRISSLFAREKP